MNVKRIGWLVLTLTLALSLVALTHCGPPEQVASQETPFETLARWVPGETEQVFFLDLKPDGEAGRHWERIRQHLEANPSGQQGLDALSHQFRVEEYGLDEFIVGPVLNGSWGGAEHVIAQVSHEDEEAAGDALRQHFEYVTWEQEEYEGRTLYHGRPGWASSRERLAWTIHDGFLFLSIRYDQQALTNLQELVSLAQEDSLAALPAWQTLRERLPETPMGLIFLNVAEQARSSPPAPDDTSLGDALLGQQVEALAFATVPEQDGMRVEIVGTVALQPDAPHKNEVHALLNLPAVDPTAWPGLPSGTAITLMAHDASVIWPWLEDMFNMSALSQLGDTAGLDLEADLVGAEGPLTGDFALAITPPLPDQPISQGLLAGQLLILARGVSEARMAAVQAAMESRGAVFGPGEVEGVPLQTQAGTEPSGYAISYGFDLDDLDNDILLFGSSPGVIGQAVTARREGTGLVTAETFRSFLETLSGDPSLLVYLNCGPLTSLAQANMTEEQYQGNEEYILLEAFEAIGISLRLAPDRLDGVVYFFVRAGD